MARKRASMREGPLAELFRATAMQRQSEPAEPTEPEPTPSSEAAPTPSSEAAPVEPLEETVEHAPV